MASHDEYPSYLDPETVERMEEDLQRSVFDLFALLRQEFGRAPTKAMDQQAVWDIMRHLAGRSAHISTGQLIDESVRAAEASSRNMLNAALAGIQLGRNETPTPQG